MTRVRKKNPPRFECGCDDCRAGCYRRPGWMTPDEAVKLIEEGFGDRLMLDLWFKGEEIDHDIFMLAPAVVDHEGKKAPGWINHRCTFLGENGRCEVHAHKPSECAVSGCKDKRDREDQLSWRRDNLARAWDSDKGREIVQKWCDEHNVEREDFNSIGGMFEMLGGFFEMMAGASGEKHIETLDSDDEDVN